jgi:hypothetical protein
LEATSDYIIVPAGISKKALYGPGRYSHKFGEVLGVAPLLGLDQRALEIAPAVLPPLLAAKSRSEEGVKLFKPLVNSLKGRHIHRPHPYPRTCPDSPIMLPDKPTL